MYPTQAYRLHRKPGVRKRKACETQGVSRTLASEAVWRGSASLASPVFPYISDRAQTCAESRVDRDRLCTLRKRTACTARQGYASVGDARGEGVWRRGASLTSPRLRPHIRIGHKLAQRVRLMGIVCVPYASVGRCERRSGVAPRCVFDVPTSTTTYSDRAQTCLESSADGIACVYPTQAYRLHGKRGVRKRR